MQRAISTLKGDGLISVSEQIELVVKNGGNFGSVEGVFEELENHKVHVLADSLSLSHHGRELLLVTSDATQAQKILSVAGYKSRTEPVVLIETKRCPGAVALLKLRLQEHGVGVFYSYVSWYSGENLFAVFKTTNNNLAVQIMVAEDDGRPVPSKPVEPAVHRQHRRAVGVAA